MRLSKGHQKTTFLRLLFILFIFFAGICSPFAQVNVQLEVLEGASTTPMCNSLIGEPIVSLIVENGPEVAYSAENCPNLTNYPNVQWDTTLNCLSDLRGGELRVCLRTYYRRAGLFNQCRNDDWQCDNNVCPNVLLPKPGTDSIYTIEVPQSLGLNSYGFIRFRITVSEVPDGNLVATNDRICHAINMGTLGSGITLGDNSQGTFNNYCATNILEPRPEQTGANWQNNVGVWFSFTTSDDPNAIVLIEATNDPEGTGDDINLQLAAYESDDNTCEGNLQFLVANFSSNSLDEHLILDCLEPNRTYFLMVDGEITTDLFLQGIFGLEIKEVPVEPLSNDDICDAIPLTVSTGMTITERYSNNCATSVDDPILSNGESTNNSVWFSFRPTQSRRVFISVNSDLDYPIGVDPIDPIIGIFYAPTNQCTGPLVEVISENAAGGSEFLSLECLNPKLTYYILVDGVATNPTGIFSVVVAERGYPDPIPIDTTICEGAVYNLGDKTYVNEGTYLDTVILADDCLEIIETNLRVVRPVELELRVQQLARAEGEAGGVVIGSAQFGTGSYQFEWSSGQTNAVANNLIGGETYCVTVTDRIAGCSADTCFTMEFPIPIDAEVQNGSLRCANDETGTLSFLIQVGKPPYQYRLQGINNPAIVQSGVLAQNDSLVTLTNLPVDSFNLFVSNSEAVQNFRAYVTAPPPISIAELAKTNASCFAACDGNLAIDISGGTGQYNLSWNQPLGNLDNPSQLCAGLYKLTVTDENNCVDSAQYQIDEPAAIATNFVDIIPVQCFGEANGQATVTASENLTNIRWDNGATTPMVNDLSAGQHYVTVTNEANCATTDSVLITQPESAIVADIEIIEAIVCGGDANGVLAERTTGGNGDYEYIWSNGQTTDFIENLTAGDYNLTVRDAKGCVDDTTVTLLEPTPIDALVETKDVTCPEGNNSGIIFLNNPMGGAAPYQFAVSGQGFNDESTITSLSAGTYTVSIRDDKGCEKVFENIIINAPPNLTVDLGGNQEVQLGKTLSLEAATNRPVSYEWTTTDSLDCFDCPVVNTRPFNSATYSVKVTDLTTGCTAEDAITIRVDKARKVFVPNVFSPNRDGINETLGITGGSDILRINRFEIYARNGSRVYQATNFLPTDNVSWDGLFNGQEAETGVYLYFAEVIFIDNATEIIQGDFTLLR
ncbi:MAG: gliding motility-associated C-terminal domain-containing protein [Bacteroidota bacterium]